MEEIKLDVLTRSEIGSQAVKKIHGAGFVPGIICGGGKKTVSVKFDRSAYERIMRQHSGETVVFHLNLMEDGKKLGDFPAIVREEQHSPETDKIQHIDFKRISLKEKIEVKVPIVAKGEPVGVKKDGGSLDHVLWELDVVCLPTQIPENLTIDVNDLELGQSIHVKDLVLPEGVVTEHDVEAIVVTVAHPMKEELPEEKLEEDTGAEPEVIKKGKEKEGDEEASAEPEKKEEEKSE